jgi:periplasmic protein TonB
MKTKTMIAAAALALMMMASGAACAQTAAQDEATRRADDILQQRIDNANADRLIQGLPMLTLEGVKQAGREQASQRNTVRVNWQNELIAHLDKHKRYPAERSQKSAEILVSFALDRMGHVLSASIVKGSGDAAFDEAAIAMVWKSDPVPMPPPFIADEGLNFTLPVIFRAKVTTDHGT